ncbi:MAG: hypothetical protein RR835_05375 [Peptostreptococcaceae bacterium]
MEHLRNRAMNIWCIIEERMNEIYGDVEFQLDDNPNNEELSDLYTVLGVISSSTSRIQVIIENRLRNKDEALNIREINEIVEIIEAIIYYLNKKIDYFKTEATCYDGPEEIVFTLILCRNINLCLRENCDYLKRVTSRFKGEQVI